MSLIEESAKGNCGEEDFDREYRRVTAHLKELRKRKEQSGRNNVWQKPMIRELERWTII